jgi:uncharacterized NAD-dependent epimerase/dehydratase family protein
MITLKGKKIAIFCEGKFGSTTSKVAASYIRYCEEQCVAVIDSTKSGQSVDNILGYGKDIPIVFSITEAIEFKPEVLLIGVGLCSNSLPQEWRSTIVCALKQGMDVVAGLHFRLSKDEEFIALAEQYGCQIWDSKEPPADLSTPKSKVKLSNKFVIHTVGTDCRVGKKTTSLELTAHCQQRGINAGMAATGQSGIYISGSGVAVDAVPADFISGAVEKLIIDSCQDYDWVVVEGQGSITHPAYSGVTLGLLHGAMPEALILCHQAELDYHKDWPDSPVQPLNELISIYEQLASYMRPAKVVGISVNCAHLSREKAEQYIKKLEQETGLPTTDVILFGSDKLVDSLINFKKSISEKIVA